MPPRRCPLRPALHGGKRRVGRFGRRGGGLSRFPRRGRHPRPSSDHGGRGPARAPPRAAVLSAVGGAPAGGICRRPSHPHRIALPTAAVPGHSALSAAVAMAGAGKGGRYGTAGGGGEVRGWLRRQPTRRTRGRHGRRERCGRSGRRGRGVRGGAVRRCRWRPHVTVVATGMPRWPMMAAAMAVHGQRRGTADELSVDGLVMFLDANGVHARKWRLRLWRQCDVF